MILHVPVSEIAPYLTEGTLEPLGPKFVLQAHSLDELVALGTLAAQAARFLEAATVSGLNILVSGGSQAGNDAGELSGRA